MSEEAAGGYGRGLEFLMKQRAKLGSGGRDWVPKLYLKTDGDIAKFRFLTEARNIFAHNFHEIPVQGRGRTFTKDVLCTRKVAANSETGEMEFVDQEDSCPYCKQEGDASLMWWKGIAWVYVYGIFSRTKTNERQQPARRGAGEGEIHGFAEAINEPRLLILKGAIANMVESANQRYGTISDRNYEWERKGKAAAQFYELVGLDRTNPPAEVLEFITYQAEAIEGDQEGRVKVTITSTDKLADLIETVTREFALEKPPTVAAAPQEGAVAQQPVGGEGPHAEKPKDNEVVQF